MNNKSYIFQDKKIRKGLDDKTFLDYYLTDDKGRERVISAVVKLGFRDKIKSVEAVYHREAPLLKVVSQASKYQKIEVTYPRYQKHANISLVSAEKELTRNIKAQSSANDFVLDQKQEMFNPSFFTLSALAVLAYFLWVAYKYLLVVN